jgi:UDP-galactopyranose mutase
MSRFAGQGRMFFIEEPLTSDGTTYLDVTEREPNLFVCVPHLPAGADASEVMPHLVDLLRLDHKIENYVTWFYTPMMYGWSKMLEPKAVIYDCMDELSGFKNPPVGLIERERELFDAADLVFTGGYTLYEAKKQQHPRVYPFPSSIDKDHFGKAMTITEEDPWQENIAHPRIGFVGVIDERMDIELLTAVADLRPDWNFVMVGPVVKIDEADLPRRDNIHYLGQRSYADLPMTIANWDAAMMPFALNDSTKYISPTKTPEFLAAGLPVVSTPISDVVRPYGEMGIVHIAAKPNEFANALSRALDEDAEARRTKVTELLRENSWDITFEAMKKLIDEAIRSKKGRSIAAEAS